MTSQQADAYLKVADVLDKEHGVTLRPVEAEAIRAAADALFFDEPDLREARDAAQDVLDALVDSGRWSEDRAATMAAWLDSCGALAATPA